MDSGLSREVVELQVSHYTWSEGVNFGKLELLPVGEHVRIEWIYMITKITYLLEDN
jgi:hypothetical protein